MIGEIIKIDYHDDHEHWVPISGYSNKKRIKRSKELFVKRGNCYFAKAVSKKIITFTYRTILKLDLTRSDFIFSKGAVKFKGRNINNSCSVEKIDWEVGISIKIPYRLNYNKFLKLKINSQTYSLRQMELIILGTLLKIRNPSKSQRWVSDKSAIILALGWKHFDENFDVFLS